MIRLYREKGISPEKLTQAEYKALINETYQILSQAVNEGIADNEIPETLTRALHRDTFLFSGFKVLNELNEAATFLTDDGKIKPFDSFKKEVQRVHTDYNVNYLQAEYHFAVGSAQMAAKWAGFEDSGYYLQYRTAADGRVRDEHAALEGITLPADDSFWDKYYPPNGWRCRCTVVQVRKTKYSQSDPNEALRKGELATFAPTKNGENKAAIFRFNPGKLQVVFPPRHPYKKMDGGDTLDRMYLRTQAKELQNWGKQNLIGTTVTHKKIDKPISFTMSGIKEFLNQPHKFIKEKNELIKNIDQVIKKAEYYSESADIKGNTNNYFYYLKTQINGEDSLIVLKETKHNNACVLYSISDTIKIKNSE